MAAQGQVFSTATNISQGSKGNASYPVMVVDSAGNISVAWIDSASGINFARSTDSGRTFTAPTTIAGSAGATFQPQMIVDPTRGIIEIAWAKPAATAGTFDVFVTQLTIGALPVTAQVTTTTPVKLVDSPRLAFDGLGVDVVWGNTEAWISRSPDGVTFPNAPINLALPNTPQDSGGPRVAVDKNGNIFVAWTDRFAQDQNQPGNYCTDPKGTTDPNGVITVFSNTFGGNVYFNATPSGSTPSATNTRSLSSTDWKSAADPRWPHGYFGCSYDNLQLFFDQNDNLHLLWADDTPTEELLSSTATPQAGGSPLFTFPIALAGEEGASSPSGSADNSGHIYAVWAAGAKAPANTEGIYFSRSDNDGSSFSQATVINAPGAISPAFPQIAVDKSGNVNIVWEQADQPITAGGSNTFHLFFAHAVNQGTPLTFSTVRELVSVSPSVLCLPPSPSGVPNTPDTTSCGSVQMGVDANSNSDIAWVNNPGSAANIDFDVADVAATPPNDFSISATTSSPNAFAGQTVTFNVTAQAVGSFSGAIVLGCNDFPVFTGFVRSDFSCTFNPSSGSFAPGTSATVTLVLPPNLPSGPIVFAINGTSGDTTHRVMVTANSEGPVGSVQPNSATLAVGASANFNVALTNPGAFSGQVTFLCGGQPAWIKCAFNPPSLNPPAGASSVLTVTVMSAPTASVLNYSPFARRLPAGEAPAVVGLILAAVCLSAMAIIGIGSREQLRTSLLMRGIAVSVLTLALAVGLVSCGGAAAPSSNSLNSSGTGGSGSSGGGGGAISPVTAKFMVQAQSGSQITNLGTVSITVP